MDFHIIIAFLVNALVTLSFINSSHASSLDHRYKRSIFSPSDEFNPEFGLDSEVEIETQLSSDNLRHVREVMSQSNLRVLGVDDDQYPDQSSNEGSAESILKEQLRNEYNSWKERNEEMFKAMNEEADIPLRRLSYTSKYLWDTTNKTIKTYNELKEICEKYKLEMVEIRHEADFASILSFIALNPNTVVALGANDVNEEGKFMEADGITPIQFQMFLPTEPDNGEIQKKSKENCIIMSSSAGDKNLIGMLDTDCKNINAKIFCQRRKDSPVYTDSLESIGKELEGLEVIGDAHNRRFYIGRTQKTWDEANKACESEGKTLLDLADDEATNQIMYPFIINWTKQKMIRVPPGFWTSGQFEQSVKSSKFTWQSNKVDFDVSAKGSVSWQWAKNEPSDSTGGNLERCIDITLTEPAKAAKMTPLLRASNCLLPFYYICFEKIFDDPSCKQNGPLKIAGPRSKYLIRTNTSLVSNSEASDICQQWGYEIAEVQNSIDQAHLWKVKSGSDFKSIKFEWHLGLNDKEREGEFFEGDMKTPISFQAFALDQPDNAKNEDCVVLKSDGGKLKMYDEKCTFEGNVLCQFPKDSSCFVNSLQNLKKPREGLIYFGETAIRRYFLSRTPKKWVDAMAFCSSRNKKLLDILFIGELEQFKGQALMPMLIGWAKKYNLGVWTSGRFPRSVKDGKFIWETTGGSFLTNDKSINFTWAKGEPSDSTHRRMEICIELAVELWADAKVGDTLVPTLKASNCLLPNYFVCYEDSPHLRNCQLPPNVDLTFKQISDTSRYIYVNAPSKMTPSQTKGLCNHWGLEMAEISSLRDYKLLSDAFDSLNYGRNFVFALGLNSVGSESMWFEGDGITPIKFQAFGAQDFKYYNKENAPLDHVQFTKMFRNQSEAPGWQMVPIKEAATTHVLCQYKKDSDCAFQHIFSYLDRKSPKDYLKRVKDDEGSSNDLMKYYVADSQQTWDDAMRFCWSRRKKLLDLSRPPYDDVQKVYKLLANYLKKIKMQPFVARFWTSGKYVDSYKDLQFRWETVNQFVEHSDAEKKYKLRVLPPEDSTSNNDKCLAIGLEDVEAKNGIYSVTLKASNCLMPHFFFCYEEYQAPKVVTTTEAPEPVVKYKDLPPCKEPSDPEKRKMQQAMQIILREIRPPGFLSCDFDIPADGKGSPQGRSMLPKVGRSFQGKPAQAKGKSVQPKGKSVVPTVKPTGHKG